MFNWDNIPKLKSTNVSNGIFDIDTHFKNLYEQKQSAINNHENADIELEKYKKHLYDFSIVYYSIFSQLFNTFDADLKEKKSTSVIKIEISGSNICYSTDELIYVNKAWNDFCDGLSITGYQYVSTNEMHSDSGKIKCKFLTISLK